MVRNIIIAVVAIIVLFFILSWTGIIGGSNDAGGMDVAPATTEGTTTQ